MEIDSSKKPPYYIKGEDTQKARRVLSQTYPNGNGNGPLEQLKVEFAHNFADEIPYSITPGYAATILLRHLGDHKLTNEEILKIGKDLSDIAFPEKFANLLRLNLGSQLKSRN